MCHAYILSASDPYSVLNTTLKTEIDEDALAVDMKRRPEKAPQRQKTETLK